MLIRWLQQVLFGPQPAGRVPGGEPRGTAALGEQGKLFDVVREALREEAVELSHLVTAGFPAVRRRRMRQRIRKGVRRSIDAGFDAPEVVEEVTERLVNVAEVDPHYARLFADDEAK